MSGACAACRKANPNEQMTRMPQEDELRAPLPSQTQPAVPHRRDRPGRYLILGEVATAVYIAIIAITAQATGFVYILFPELGALSHDILKRPHGTWAKAPVMLVVTPLLTAIIGTLIARNLPYGVLSILASVSAAILIIRMLRSPIAPAISAGLLPVTLGLTSWWYPPSLLLGTGLLAGVALSWRRFVPAESAPIREDDIVDDVLEEAPRHYSWIPFFFAFLIGVAALAVFTGWRLLLYPPLVVIGFEMFAHSAVCPWARRPLLLPIACALTAGSGVMSVALFGVGPVAAVCSTAFGIITLRLFDLHVPPALAVGLLPFIMVHPTYTFPFAVGIGTLLLTLSFLLWQKLALHRVTFPS